MIPLAYADIFLPDARFETDEAIYTIDNIDGDLFVIDENGLQMRKTSSNDTRNYDFYTTATGKATFNLDNFTTTITSFSVTGETTARGNVSGSQADGVEIDSDSYSIPDSINWFYSSLNTFYMNARETIEIFFAGFSGGGGGGNNLPVTPAWFNGSVVNNTAVNMTWATGIGSEGEYIYISTDNSTWATQDTNTNMTLHLTFDGSINGDDSIVGDNNATIEGTGSAETYSDAVIGDGLNGGNGIQYPVYRNATNDLNVWFPETLGGEFTVTFWDNFTSNTPGDLTIRNIIDASGTVSTDESGYQIQTGTVSGTPQPYTFEITENGTSDKIQIESDFTTGTSNWLHMAFVYNGNGTAEGMSLWVNATEHTNVTRTNTNTVSTFPFLEDSTSANEIRVNSFGDQFGLGSDLGSLDDLRVYPKALNSTEISAIFNERLQTDNFEVFANLITNDTYYFKVHSSNGSGWSVPNYTSINVNTNVPDTPSLAVDSTTTSSITFQSTEGNNTGRVTPHQYSVRCELNESGSWVTEVTNASMPGDRKYTKSGLGAGDDLTCQWQDTNTNGPSAWSNNATDTTLEPTVATLTLNHTNVGDVQRIQGIVLATEGSPSPFTINFMELYINGTLHENVTLNQNLPKNVATDVNQTWWVQIQNDFNWNFTGVVSITNVTGNVEFSDEYEDIRDYDPDYFSSRENPAVQGTVNYTLSRSGDGATLNTLVNRNQGNNTWQIECIYQDSDQARTFSSSGLQGTWRNLTDTGYYTDTRTVPSNDNIYISCYNEDLLFSTVSYSSLNATLASIAALNDSLGNLFGVPHAIFFVVMVASLATGRTASVFIVLTLASAGIMIFLGFFTIPDDLWGMALIAGALGIFAAKKFL